MWPQETLLAAKWWEPPSSENLNWYFWQNTTGWGEDPFGCMFFTHWTLSDSHEWSQPVNPKDSSRILLNFLLPWFRGYSSIMELWNRNMWWADSQKWEEIRKKVSLRIVSIRLPDKLIHFKQNLFSLSAKFLVENAEYIQSPLCLVTALLIFSQLCSIIR